MNTKTNTMSPGQWYEMDLAYGSSKLLTITTPTGTEIRLIGRGLSEPCGTFNAIDMDGHRNEVSPLQIGRMGIGRLTYRPDIPPSGPEDWQALTAKGEQAQRKAAEDRAKEAAESKARAAALPAMFPTLETYTGKKTDHALGAANIRRELKKAFPGIRFSVKSESFTGGNSIDISWTDGPTGKQVEEITDRYQKGSFDGMEDLYTYNREEFPRVFGGAKYVHTHRSISPEGFRRAWILAGFSPNDVPAEIHWKFWDTDIGGAIRRNAYDTDLQEPST
jgi:hypothetical protein